MYKPIYIAVSDKPAPASQQSGRRHWRVQSCPNFSYERPHSQSMLLAQIGHLVNL